MESSPRRLLPKPNPQTQQAHRREVFWQITLPALIGSTLILSLAVLVAWAGASGTGEVDRWAEVSLIWLLLPMLFITLIALLFVAGLAYAVSRVLGVLPPYAHVVQNFFLTVKLRVRRISNKLIEPALRAHSLSAAFRALRRSLRS